jgi:CheY-like chemotaxis protein
MQRGLYDPFALRGLCVLLVEDEYLIAMALCSDLEGVGASVLGPVATSEEALELLEAGPRPDMALLDIRLRHGTSFALADRLRDAGVPLVFCSSQDREEIPPRFAGVPLCPKPCEIGCIIAAFARAGAAG